MQNWISRGFLVGALALASIAGPALAAEKPNSIIHVVTLYWKDGTTDAQKKQVFDGIETMAKKFPGITRVWLKSVKVQGDAGGKPLTSAFVMEFKDEAAFARYANDPAHKEWEKIYIPVRGESRTHDITN